MITRIYHLLLKEFLQLKRDKSARLRLLVPPVLQMLLFGYAATFEVRNVTTVVVDQDRSVESRALIADFVHSNRFQLVAAAPERRQAQAAIEDSTALLGIVVPPGFAALLRKGQSAPIQGKRLPSAVCT